jgi:hypothetical protein
LTSDLGALNEHPLTLPDFDPRQRIEGEPTENKPLQSGSLSSYPYARAIRLLLEQGRILEAQRLFEFAKDRIQDPKIHKALAPPRIKTSSKRDVDRSAEFRWLDLNSARFRGKWVALLGERLVASADTLKELLAQIKAAPQESKPLVHHVD